MRNSTRFPIVIKRAGVKVKICRSRNRDGWLYQVPDYASGRCRLRSFADLQDAQREAELAHGEFAIRVSGEPDRRFLALTLVLGKLIGMKYALWLMLRLLAGLTTLPGSRGTRAVLAENLILKRQLLVIRRVRRRAPNLRTAAHPDHL
jgi:hypothetical protein